MSVGSWWAFVTLVWVSLVVPGPDFVVVVRAALIDIGRGYRVAAGVVTGLCAHASLAVFGLEAALVVLPHVLPYLQGAGGLVLLWLGSGMLFSRSHGTTEPGPGPARTGHPFLSGFAVNATNPKALLFFLSVLPGFLGPDRPVWSQAGLLGLTIVCSAALWWTVVLVATRHLPPARNPRTGVLATRAGGALLATMGVALVIEAF